MLSVDITDPGETGGRFSVPQRIGGVLIPEWMGIAGFGSPGEVSVLGTVVALEELLAPGVDVDGIVGGIQPFRDQHIWSRVRPSQRVPRSAQSSRNWATFFVPRPLIWF